MRNYKNLLILIPLAVSTIFIVNGFITFLVLVYPKFNDVYEKKLNLLNDAKEFHNYPIYLLIYFLILLITTLAVSGTVIYKKTLNITFFLIASSIFAIYSTNVFGALAANLVVEGMYLPLQAISIKNMESLRNGIQACKCSECISNYKRSSNGEK